MPRHLKPRARRTKGLLQAIADRRGAVAAEFVLAVPLFFLIVLATTDLVRVFRAQIRMEAVAVQIGQIVSQCSRITTTGDTGQFWAHATRIAGDPVDVDSTAGGSVVISALSRNDTNPNAPVNRRDWFVRTGNPNFVSTFQTIGTATPVISGRDGTPFVVPVGQTLLATEVLGIIQAPMISAGLIGNVLPGEVRGISMFLSRAIDPARLQAQPSVSNTRDCTA